MLSFRNRLRPWDPSLGRPSRVAPAAVVCGALIATVAGAQLDSAAAGPRYLSWNDAIELGMERHAVTAVRRARRARRTADRAVRRPSGDPSVTFQVGRRVRPAAERGAELQATVMQGFALGPLGRARLGAVSAERDALAAEERAEVYRGLFEAAAAWLELYRAESHVASAAVVQRAARLVRDAALEGVRAGSQTRTQAGRAAREYGVARAASVAATQRLARAQLALSHAASIRASIRVATHGRPPDPGLPTSLTLSESRLSQLPALVLARARTERARAQLREVEASSRGAAAAGVYLERDAGRGVIVAGVLQLTPRISDGGGRERARAAVAYTRAEADAEEAHRHATLALRHDLQAARAATTAATEHRESVLAPVQGAMRAVEEAHALQAATRAEVAEARLELALTQGRQQALDLEALRRRLLLHLLLEAAEASR